MKHRNQTLPIAALAAVLIASFAGATAAHAAEIMVGQMPFAFTIGDTTFPAGEYRFEVDRLTSGTMLVQGTKSSTSAISLACKVDNASSSRSPVIEFNMYGEQRFVSLIRTSRGTAVSFAQGSQERSLAKAGLRPSVAIVLPAPALQASRF